MGTDARPADQLEEALRSRQGENPAYSLRAFARDLGVSHSYLSLILGGKRRLPESRALEFARALRWSPPKAKAFVASTRTKPLPASKRTDKNQDFQFLALDLDRFRTISDWYHVAILDLVHLKNFQSDPSWIASTLGVPRRKVEQAIRRLFRLGLLDIDSDGNWKKVDQALKVPVHRPTEAVRHFHSQMIDKAKDALHRGKFESRDITGTTIPVNPERLPEAKKKIARFRKRLLAYLSEGECSQLYQLNVQLFPLAKDES